MIQTLYIIISKYLITVLPKIKQKHICCFFDHSTITSNKNILEFFFVASFEKFRIIISFEPSNNYLLRSYHCFQKTTCIPQILHQHILSKTPNKIQTTYTSFNIGQKWILNKKYIFQHTDYIRPTSKTPDN